MNKLVRFENQNTLEEPKDDCTQYDGTICQRINV